jgi:ubiquinone/menaquinone biosynthesis C-methylase UbiE
MALPERGNIITYYRNSADTYRRWGAGYGALHLGFFPFPGEAFAGKEPDQIASSHLESHATMLRKVMGFIQPNAGEVIVDAGCGSGSMITPLASVGARVIGVNIVDHQLADAETRINNSGLRNNSSLVQADYHSLPLRSNSADKVLFFESLSHAADTHGVLVEANRVLNDQGELIVIDPMLYLPREELDQATATRLAELDEGMALHIDSYPDLVASMQALGLSVISSEDIVGNVFPSMHLAAMSAESHMDDPQADMGIVRHRRATIACRDLMKEKHLQYRLIKARKR